MNFQIHFNIFQSTHRNMPHNCEINFLKIGKWVRINGSRLPINCVAIYHAHKPHSMMNN